MNISLRRIFFSQLFGWIALAVVGFFYLYTFDGFMPKLRPDRINFGIDLVGGTYITLEVQTQKAIEAELADKLQYLSTALSNEKIASPVSQKIENNTIFLTFDSVDAAQSAASFINSIESGMVYSTEGTQVKLSFSDADAKKIKEAAVRGNIDVLRSRLDDLGVGEISISQQGEKNIIVELPNVEDPQKAKERIGTTALLELKSVEREASSRDQLLEPYDWQVPEGMEVVQDKRGTEFYLVPAYTDLTGRLLKDAYAALGRSSQYGREGMAVYFQLKPEGADKFYELTKKAFGRKIAIIIDGKVISAPNVNEPIKGGNPFISGGFTAESAKELAKMLRSGAFVAPVTFAEERRIGPSLGAESIRSGLLACLVGLLLLVIFSIVVYKTAGLFAFLALIYNLFLILLILSWLRATLTLPGIAGMVLTVGMAIDASILIYEKIREELAARMTLGKAVSVGFSDAMQVILDSNITTFLVGIVLYKYGVGPIQGFAVTMMVGIISTLITGLFFLRSIFTFAISGLGVQKIKI
jgi:protein-export membrane protein SecD